MSILTLRVSHILWVHILMRQYQVKINLAEWVVVVVIVVGVVCVCVCVCVCWGGEGLYSIYLYGYILMLGRLLWIQNSELGGVML